MLRSYTPPRRTKAAEGTRVHWGGGNPRTGVGNRLGGTRTLGRSRLVTTGGDMGFLAHMEYEGHVTREGLRYIIRVAGRELAGVDGEQ